MNDFEIVKSTRGNVPQQNDQVIITPSNQVGQPNLTGNEKLKVAVADNFGNILNLATEIVNIRKVKVQSNATIKQMEESRKCLLAEADAYAIKKNADTKSIVDKMNIIRYMMNDFYNQGNQQISGEDFRVIITEIVNQMCRVEHEC